VRIWPSSPRARLLLGAVVVAAAGGIWFALRPPRIPDLPTAEVTRGDFVQIVETRGEIRPFRSVVVTAPFQAGELQILEMAPAGSSVKKGDVVARFDALTLRRTVQDRQGELRQAQAELDQAREQAKIAAETDRTAVMKARYDVDRAKLDIGDPEILSLIETERSKLALADAEQRLTEMVDKDRALRSSGKADLGVRERKIAKIQNDIALAERALASLQVVAPADGTVSIMPNYRNSSPMGAAAEFRQGDRAWPGAQILELPDLSSVHLSSRIDEVDRGQLKVEQTASVRVDAIPDREYRATVSVISLLARVDFSSGWPPAKNFDLKLTVQDADTRLKPGMSAVARIAVGRIPDMLLVPAGAVFNVEGRTVVYRRGRRGFEPVEVEVARRSREQVAIKSGIAPGDRVALTRPDAAERKPGQ
jgi:HlyD family secretion protein